jgi:hypothetical protein
LLNSDVKPEKLIDLHIRVDKATMDKLTMRSIVRILLPPRFVKL